MRTRDRHPYILVLPSMFTTGNLFCGFYSVLHSFSHDFERAAYAIILLTALGQASYYASIPLQPFALQILNGIQMVFGIGISAGILVLGWQVLNLKARLGALAVWYGCLALLSGVGLTFFLLPVGIAVEVLLYGLGTILLYRMSLSQK